MPEPYPNQFLSIPQSIVSLKHYFRVHDQPFSRSLIYLVVVGLAVALYAAALAYFGYQQVATAQAKALAQKLAAVHFEGGQAKSDVDQPAIVWRDTGLFVVLDTTGKLDTLEKAMEFAGCMPPARYFFFGTSAIQSREAPATPAEAPKVEEYKYTDSEKLAAVRKAVEDAGGKMPAFKIVNSDAQFDPASVPETHPAGGEFPVPSSRDLAIPLQNSALMVIVDTTGKKRNLKMALDETVEACPEMVYRFGSEFFGLLSAKGVQLRRYGQKEATAWDFAAGASPASVADRIAAEIRKVRTESIFPTAVTALVMGVLILFVFSLMLSAGGMLANGLLRANLAYGELLTVAIYAATPAVVAFLIVATVLQGRGGQWPLIVPFAIGMAYTAMAVHRTARELAQSGAPQL